MLKILTFCEITFFVSLLLTPAMRALAWHIGAVDVPSDGRRMHQTSIARCGGLAIFGALTVGVLAAGLGQGVLSRILAGGIVMLAVGLADDIYATSPWQKLGGQMIAAYIVCKGGGFPAEVQGVFWIVLLSNAHNLIDGMDGLFAGSAVIESGALALILALGGMNDEALLVLLIGCACGGFWLHNRHPASIFAGDCGSCMVGYLLGACSLPLLQVSVGAFGRLGVPLLIFAYPLTDLATAVIRRILRLESPFGADKGHLHHRLYAAGLTTRQCNWILHLLLACLASVAVLLWGGQSPMLASLACLMAVAWMIAVRIKVLFISQKK